MSHSLEINGYTAHFNGDFSGEVQVISPMGDRTMTMPIAVMEAVVAEKIRRRSIAELEEGTPGQVLMFFWPSGKRHGE